MKQITITGANGFTGSHILENIKALPKSEFNIIASCRTKSKLPKFYTGNTLIGDLLDDDYVAELTEKSDIICHTAAWAEMNGSMESSIKYFYNPTIKLIDLSLENGVKRFVFLSAITSNPIEKGNIHSNRKIKDIWTHYDSILKIEKYLEKIKGKGMEIVILRVGYFTGKNYSLGLLPILLPRLKTHLVPWIENGNTTLPLIDGQDIGLAFKLSITTILEKDFNIIDIVGKEIPTVKEVFKYLNKRYNYPLPHFSVSFKLAYAFAYFMKFIHRILPNDPLIVPAIVLLLEETNASNGQAKRILDFNPKVHWKDSIDMQIEEMKIRQTENMKMNKA